MGICCPDGERGFGGIETGIARFERGIYGVYVVCGAVAGCLGGGGMGPVRMGGGGAPLVLGSELADIGGVCGGEPNMVDAVGLVDAGEDGAEFPLAGPAG